MKAIEAQLANAIHTAFQVNAYESYIALAEKLNALAPIEGPAKTIFFTTGAEAVENAVKIARYATKRSGVVSFSGAFHGRTFMGMALTGKVVPYKAGFGEMPGDVYRLPFPVVSHGHTSAEALAALDNLFKFDVEPTRIAAIIIEPVQGEGGFYTAPFDFLRSLARGLRQARHHADRRRNPIGLRAHRQTVRDRTFRRQTRSDHDGEKPRRRHAALGRHRPRRPHGRARTRRPRRHLCRQPRRLRGGARGARRHQGRTHPRQGASRSARN